MAGPLLQVHFSRNKYWKRSVQRGSCSKRLVKSCSKRYDFSDLGHFWLSYDGFTVISVRVWYVWSVFSSSLNQYWQSTISDKHYSNRLVKSYSKRYGVSDLSHFWLSYDGFTVISVRFGISDSFFRPRSINIDNLPYQADIVRTVLSRATQKGMMF